MKQASTAPESAPERGREMLDERHNVRNLAPRVRAFRLCLMCNAPLRPASLDEIDDRVPESVRECHTRFVTCDICRHVFWEGSHWKRMRERIDSLA